MDAEQGKTRSRPSTVDGASMGSVLVLLHDAKNEITNETRIRAEALHKDLAEKSDATSNSVVQNVLSGVSSHSLAVPSGSSRSRTSDERKRKAPPPLEKMTFLDVLLAKYKTPFVVQWTMIVTLLSFARTNSAFLGWVLAAAQKYMAEQTGLLQDVSGLSVLFFSVEADHKWTRYHGKIGKLWSFVLRRSISSMILSVRASDFDTQNTPTALKRGRTVPPWLDSFGGKKSTAAIVSEIVQCLETTEEMTRTSGNVELAKRRKRMRTGGEPPGDEFESERDYCVNKCWSAVLRTWSYGRVEARKIVTGSVMFVVEKIRSYGSISEAKSDGFEVVFQKLTSSEETFVPTDVSGTIWDIPMAVTRNGSEEELRDKNNTLLQELARRFPSLHLTLRYKRAVSRPEQNVDQGGVPPFWAAEEDVSLHQLAVTVLTASLNAKSIKAVFQTSGLSLRTVHVLAIWLRGLIRQSLNLDLTDLEQCALGGVTREEVAKDSGDMVTTIAGVTRLAGASSMQSIRDAKLTISFAAYRAEAAKAEAARRTEEESARSEAGEVHHEDGQDSDLAESWLEGIG